MADSVPDFSLAAVAVALGPLAPRFDVDAVAICESTNASLLERAGQGAPSGSVLVAQRQTAGRGRMGRQWFSSPGASLTFSLLWRLPPGRMPAGLSLVVGLALAEALESMGVAELALKWPNDLLLDGRKLAGILIELAPGSDNAFVIGVGLNLKLPTDLPQEVRATATALDTAIPGEELLARLLVALHGVLTDFGAAGFAFLRDRWLARCAHLYAPVRILSEFASPTEGRCVGVDGDGALQLETPIGILRVLSGDVSLRMP